MYYGSALDESEIVVLYGLRMAMFFIPAQYVC